MASKIHQLLAGILIIFTVTCGGIYSMQQKAVSKSYHDTIFTHIHEYSPDEHSTNGTHALAGELINTASDLRNKRLRNSNSGYDKYAFTIQNMPVQTGDVVSRVPETDEIFSIEPIKQKSLDAAQSMHEQEQEVSHTSHSKKDKKNKRISEKQRANRGQNTKIISDTQPSIYKRRNPESSKKRCSHGGKREAADMIGNVFQDALILHKNLFAWDTLKVATIIFPLFVGARIIDNRLQSCFYDQNYHRNIQYIPKWCHNVAQWSIAVPFVALGSQIFFGSSEELRETSKVFMLGFPFVFWTKTFVKKIDFDAGMRPWHEDFNCERRAGGGFPSGHMAEAMYTALLYGLRFGPRFAVPLGALATGIGVTFIACNRHYLSQIVAGAGFGAVYALAAYKLVDTKMSENLKLGVKFENGKPALLASYTF